MPPGWTVQRDDWKTPYPGDNAILPPSQVPGANLPAGYLGD